MNLLSNGFLIIKLKLLYLFIVSYMRSEQFDSLLLNESNRAKLSTIHRCESTMNTFMCYHLHNEPISLLIWNETDWIILYKLERMLYKGMAWMDVEQEMTLWHNTTRQRCKWGVSGFYTHIHIHTYIHTYTHTYIHTYIHTYYKYLPEMPEMAVILQYIPTIVKLSLSISLYLSLNHSIYER